jgi:hypothetical protein
MDVIDTTLLNEFKKSFEKEKKEFKLKTYKTFQNSYIMKSDDANIKEISIKLDTIYKSIEKSYDLIDDYFKKYLNDILALENYLSEKGRIGLIKENELRNYVSTKLEKIK